MAGADEDFVEGRAIDDEPVVSGRHRTHTLGEVSNAHVLRGAVQGSSPRIGQELPYLRARREGIGSGLPAAGTPSVEAIVCGGDDGAIDVKAPLRRLLRAIHCAGAGGVGIKDGDIHGDGGALDEFFYGPQPAWAAADDGDAAGRFLRAHSESPSTRAASSGGEMSKCSQTQESL